MKKLLLILFCAGSVSLFAQSKFLQPMQAADRQAIVEDVISSTGKPFVLQSVDTSKSKQVISYILVQDDRKIGITFVRYLEGGNYDLEIKPDTVWKFNNIIGLYMDLFPYWKLEFQPDANLEQISADAHGKLILYNEATKQRARFIRSASKWVIEVYH